MDNPAEKELEKLAHESLRALPLVKAPRTLMPRVRAILEERISAPWWRRSLWTWPSWGQYAFLGIALLLAAGAGLASREVGQTGLLERPGEWVNPWVAQLSTLWGGMHALAGSGMRLLESFGQGFIFVAAGVVVGAYLMCVGVGTLVFRLLQPQPHG